MLRRVPLFSVRVATLLASYALLCPPLLAQAKRLEPSQSDGFFQTKNGQYVLTFGLLVTAALLVAYAIKLK